MDNIKIMPYNSIFRDGVIEVLKYLWDMPKDTREEIFEWEYVRNPNFEEILAVIAVNDEDEVIGFRGWVPGIVWQNGHKYIVARAADAVVSPHGRRQGIFSKMTLFSLSFLKEKGIHAIINLSSNSQSNPGNRKLGWIAIGRMNIWYQILLNINSPNVDKVLHFTCDNHNVELYPYIPLGLKTDPSDKLSFSNMEGQLDWFARRPNKKYLTLVAYDTDRKIKGLFIVDLQKSIARLIFYFCDDVKLAFELFKIMRPYIKSNIISAWGWALSEHNQTLLRKIGFVSIPFYEIIKKKPPILVRSIDDTKDQCSWQIADKDIRKLRNWNINQIDDF